MPLLAINVALVFPNIAPLKAANQHLLSINPNGFKFGVNQKPHLTLLQDFIEDCPKNITQLAAALTPVIMNSPTIKSICFKAVSALEGLSPALIIEDNDAIVTQLHSAIVDASAPFSVDTSEYTNLSHAFFSQPSPSGSRHAAQFRKKHSNSDYDPHLTLGKAQDICPEALKPYFNFPLKLQPQGIVLAQLGRSGTVSDNVFARW